MADRRRDGAATEDAGNEEKTYRCSVCDKAVSFCWRCPCGFSICAVCMEENAWGMTCNNITWECPDCGRFRSF